MTYPMQHRIDMRHKYTSADKTDIRILFAKVRRDAANQANTVLDADPVPTGTAQREEPEFSRAECF